MLMLNATYSFFLGADHRLAHVRGIDVATPDENVTLAERHAR
jgi:hypothetical protein